MRACDECGLKFPDANELCSRCGGKLIRICPKCQYQNAPFRNDCQDCGTPLPGGSAGGAESAASASTSAPGAERSGAAPATGGAPPAAPAPAPEGGSETSPRASAPASQASATAQKPPAPAQASGEKPPPPKPAFSNAQLGGIVLFLGLSAVFGSWAWGKAQPKLRSWSLLRAARTYLNALEARDYDTAYGLLSETARANVSTEEFKKFRENEVWEIGDVRVVYEEPGGAIIRYEIKEGTNPWTPDYMTFVWENGRWGRPYVWHIFLGIDAALEKNDGAEALRLAQAAVTVDPQNPLGYFYLCHAEAVAGRHDRVIRDCERALTLSFVYPVEVPPETIRLTHAVIADTYKNVFGKHKEAAERYALLLRLPGLSPEERCSALSARAVALGEIKKYRPALADFRSALPLCAQPQQAKIQEDIDVLSGAGTAAAIARARDLYRKSPESAPPPTKGKKKVLKESWEARQLAGPEYRVTVTRAVTNGRQPAATSALTYRVNLWTGEVAGK